MEADSPAAVPGQLMEEPVQEEDPALRRLPLKNGAGEMKLAAADVAAMELRLLLEHEPALFPALRALIDGPRHEVGEEQFERLRGWGMLTKAGAVRREFSAVMAAAYRETPDGPVIVDPFDMTNPDHAAAVRLYHRQNDEIDERLNSRTKPWEQDKDLDSGPSR